MAKHKNNSNNKKNPDNFKFKNFLFDVISCLVYSGYGIAFDGTGSWSFGNKFPGNFVISGVGNSSLSHTDVKLQLWY